MPALKRIFSALLLFVIILLVPITTYAQSTGPSSILQGSSLVQPTPSLWDSFFQGSFSTDVLVNSISCFLTMRPFGGKACTITVLKNNGTGYAPTTMLAYNGEGGGALGSGTRFMAQIYSSQPASGVQYVAEIYRSGFGIEKPAYAQVGGSGAAVLQPVKLLWQISRDISYIFFILIFVAVGFMIMFRSKINPQTVVSLQNALPGLIVGLVLVTFSYFIAGLIVDLTFVVAQFAGIVLLSQTGLSSNASVQIQNLLNNQNVVTMFMGYVWNFDLWSDATKMGLPIGEVFSGPVVNITLGLVTAAAACLNPIGLSIGAVTGGWGLAACGGVALAAGTAGPGYLISGFIYIILLFGLFQALIRLIFALVRCYVTIVVTTIFGPFIILFSSIPGQGGNLSAWWKTILGNALAFPAVFGLFILVDVILSTSRAPGQTITQTLPLFGGTPVGFIPIILAYGLLLAAPAVPSFIRELLGVKMNQTLNKEISTNIGTGKAMGTFVGTTGGYTAYKWLGGGLMGVARPMGWRLASELRKRGFGP